MVHPFVRFVTGASACYVGVAIYLGVRQEKRVTTHDYYTKAVEIIQTDRYLVERLGKPIKVQLQVGHSLTIDEDLKAHFLVKLRGQINKGVAFISADRKSEEEKWVLKKIEVASYRNPNDKLVIFEKEPAISSEQELDDESDQ